MNKEQLTVQPDQQLEVEAEGWWNEDHDVYTWPVRVGKWGAKIECHGSGPMEAQALALHVVTAIGAIGKATPAPEIEAPTAVGALILGGAVSSTELGDNDMTLDSQVVERLQREMVKDSEDIAVELMLVGQHYRILQALRAERDAAQARVAELEGATGYVEARQCANCRRIGINDSSGTAACHDCDWQGPEPTEDKCPGCGNTNCMAASCPDCGGRYELMAVANVAAPVAQAGQVQDGWKVSLMGPDEVIRIERADGKWCGVTDLSDSPRDKLLYEMLKPLAAAPQSVAAVPQAWLDVQAERRRQIEAEGWTLEHDDQHQPGELAQAAVAYLLYAFPREAFDRTYAARLWPWISGFKPTGERRDLERGLALGLAALERLDRAAAAAQGGE